MKRRLLSLLLAAALCVGLLPAGAFALEAPAAPGTAFEQTSEQDVVRDTNPGGGS